MRRVLFLAIFVACASQQNAIRIVKNFREARERRDFVAAQAYLARGASVWFEEKSGPGEPYLLGGGRWDHWDRYFHSKNDFYHWREDGRTVTVSVRETNDFMTLLDWHAPPYTMTFWLDEQDHISGVLIKSGGKPVSRLAEFKSWLEGAHPGEPPHDRRQPGAWHELLEEWRRSGSPVRRRQPGGTIDHRRRAAGVTAGEAAGVTGQICSRRGAPSADASAPRASSRSSAAAARRACRRSASSQTDRSPTRDAGAPRA